MTRINSRDKGRRYERHIGKLLRDWWGGTEHDFRPQDMGRRQPGGDLKVPPGFPWHVECKHRDSEWNWGGFLQGSCIKTGPRKWYDVARQENASGLVTVLIFTRNREPDYFAVATHHGRDLRQRYGLEPMLLAQGLCIYPFEEVLRVLDPEAVRMGFDTSSAGE